MALSIEWFHRVELWQKALWELIYVPIGEIPLEGFTTFDQLTFEQACKHPTKPMPAGTQWGAKWEYGWFKGSLQIPTSAAGERVVARIYPTDQESLVWVNGKPYGSFGWGHREIPLVKKAKGGEKFDVMLESYAGHGHITVGDGPYPYGVQSVPEPAERQQTILASTFGLWREEIYQAALDFTTLFELAQQLDPLSLRACEIDECLMETTLLIDPELPHAELLESIHKGRERMRPLLEKKNGPTMPTLHAFGHAHIDVAWLWPLQHTERKMAMTMLNQFLLFEEYPEFVFLQSQPHLYWMMEQKYPEIFSRIIEAIKAGRLLPDGGMWIEADTNLSGGEALIRQILYGRRYFKETLGVDSDILWLPDVFGYSGALPQILLGCGMKGFATQKITWAYNGGESFPYNTFWWEGIDGTAIPAHIFTDYNSELRPKAIFERWNTRLKKHGINSMMLAFGWGDGGGGPTRDHLEYYNRIQDLEGLPRVQMSSPKKFFTDLAQQGMPRERYIGELYFQAHRGTYTSQAKTKRGNRKSEIALREAEFWDCIAGSFGNNGLSPQTLWPVWRSVLLNQFHDILPGSSIHRVYEEAEAAYAEALTQANQAIHNALDVLVTDEPGQVFFNSLPWPRNAIFTQDGVLAQVEVPACGWAIAKGSTQKGNAKAQLYPAGFTLENEYLTARFDGQARLTSLLEKDSGREWMAGLGNDLLLYKDVPTKWDAWDLDSMAELQPVVCSEPAAFELGRQDPYQVEVLVKRMIGHSLLRQTIILRSGSRRIDFETQIDWQESHRMLKVAFPVDVHTTEAISEIQFGHLRRPNHRSRQYDQDRYEVSNHKWTALAEEARGAAVLNDCKYGLSALGKSINLTLLKSAMAPDMTADKGLQTFTYSLYTWNGPFSQSGVVREAYDLNIPLQSINGRTATERGSFFTLDRENIVIEALKPAEDGSGDLIVRLYESMHASTNCSLKTILPVSQAFSATMLEEPGNRLHLQNGEIPLEFRPFEIKTIRLILK